MQDINECLEFGTCSQGCVNTNGSYYCKCVNKFRLKNDNKTCKSISGTEPFLLYAGERSIHAVLLKSRHQYVVADKLHQTIGVSYDGHHIYWTDIAMKTESIMRAREDGSELEVLLTAGLSAPEDIAIDWLTGNMYFTDTLYMHIAVCSNDALHCTFLVNEDVHRPRGIALYPQKGTMYWSDWGDKPMIATSNMDGTNPRPLVNKDLHWPNGVTLDWPNERLYWVDAKLKRIESIRLDGTGRYIVLEHVLKHPYGIAVFENNIYWSDWDTKNIQTCNKFNCKDREIIVKDRKIYGKNRWYIKLNLINQIFFSFFDSSDIHVYHSANQPTGNNACVGNKCSHLCLLSNQSFSCACPKGMALNVDQITCSHTSKPLIMYLGIRNYLISLEHQTFGKHEPGEGEALSMHIHKMAYNILTGDIFIADNHKKVIFVAKINSKSTTTKQLVSSGIGKVSSLAFGKLNDVLIFQTILIFIILLDHLGNNLYWSDEERGTIEVMSLNTNYRAIVRHFVDTNKPIALALVPENG